MDLKSMVSSSTAHSLFLLLEDPLSPIHAFNILMKAIFKQPSILVQLLKTLKYKYSSSPSVQALADCAAMAKIKASDLLGKKGELLKQLDYLKVELSHLKVELSQLRVIKVTGSVLLEPLDLWSMKTGPCTAAHKTGREDEDHEAAVKRGCTLCTSVWSSCNRAIKQKVAISK